MCREDTRVVGVEGRGRNKWWNWVGDADGRVVEVLGEWGRVGVRGGRTTFRSAPYYY